MANIKSKEQLNTWCENLIHFHTQIKDAEFSFVKKYVTETLTDAYVIESEFINDLHCYMSVYYHIKSVGECTIYDNESLFDSHYIIQILDYETFNYIETNNNYISPEMYDELVVKYKMKQVFFHMGDKKFSSDNRLLFIDKERYLTMKERSNILINNFNAQNESDYKRYLELKSKFENS